MSVDAQKALTKQYCTGCHNEKLKSGEMSLSDLDLMGRASWAEPEITSANRLPMRAPLVPFPDLDAARTGDREAVDLDAVCGRLERDGWEVGNATPVAVPLALIPFDPGRIPKTVLAYLYARHPEIETYCFLVQARRPVAGLPRRRAHTPASPAAFSTLPWKTESEWREEARQCAARLAGRPPYPEIAAAARVEEVARRAPEDTGHMFEALRLEWRRSDEELFHIKSSLTWRAIVKYRTWRERLLPPQTRRGRLYERTRSAIRRLALGGR
jgi:hypothetical protein